MAIINNGKIKLLNPERIYDIDGVSFYKHVAVDIENDGTCAFYDEYNPEEEFSTLYIMRVEKTDNGDLTRIETSIEDMGKEWEHIVEL